MTRTRSAFEHPFFLTLVVLYSASIGVAFASFPPVRWPLLVTDVFLGATLLQFVAFIVLSYAHGAASTNYTVNLFLLKALVAILFSWAFRLLDTAGAMLLANRSPRVPLITYYFACVVVFLTMVWFVRWTATDMTEAAQRNPAGHYIWLRSLGLLAVTVGAIFEALAPLSSSITQVLPHARHLAAGALLVLAILYFLNRPWARFSPRET